MKIQRLIVLFLFISCQNSSNNPVVENRDHSAEIIQMFNIPIKCQNQFFPTIKSPISNELVVFFNNKSCSSCIIDIKNHVDVISRSYNIDAKFYTNTENKDLNGINKLIPELNIISVDSLFSNLEYPILFETNSVGQVINCMPINASYLYIGFDYIKQYALNHPRLLK